MSVWGVRGPVQFALPEPFRNVDPDFHRVPLRRIACDVGALEVLGFALKDASGYLRCAILELAPFETDRLSSPYQLEEPSSRTYPHLTSRVALQAPPADSKSTGSSSCFLGLSRERGKQAVLTCKSRDASSRLGEELEVDTPRRLLSCTANEAALASDSASSRACSSG
jgi:hypothetical protein